MSGEDKVTISSVCWIPRGAAKAVPTRYESTENEQEELKALVAAERLKAKQAGELPSKSVAAPGGEVEDDDMENEGKGQATKTVKEELGDFEKAFDMDNYDDDDEFEGQQFFSVLDTDGPMARNDPLLKDEEDSEDEDAVNIQDTDLLLVAASAEQDWSILEVYLYDEEKGAFYVHHDVPIGGYPLCLEWLSKSAANPGGLGNYIAVGSFEDHIDIWDLDVLDALEPVVVLGGTGDDKGKGKKKVSGGGGKAKKKKGAVQSHTSAVMCLAANPLEKHVLASGSADETVRVWDVLQQTSLHCYTHHSNKVQTVKWHPVEASVLLTASYDKSVALLDARQPDAVLRAPLPGDAETACWDRHNPAVCYVSSDDGSVTALDARVLRSQGGGGGDGAYPYLWRVKAHKQATTGVADCGVPNMLMTCSLDGTAKVWNLADIGADGNPAEVMSRDLKGGKLFCCQSSPDESTLFGFGGKVVVLWDVTDSPKVVEAFNLQAPAPSAA